MEHLKILDFTSLASEDDASQPISRTHLHGLALGFARPCTSSRCLKSFVLLAISI
jgi:hypothetical protein